ncbi:MAG: RnfH family protein [Cupriavidus sp.]|nr:MAG: RnfH family protein [Cupriavidus sp.]
MAKAEMISVDVVYALPKEQRIFRVDLPEPATVGEAIRRSGILGHYAQIDLASAKVGVFGRMVSLEAALRQGDRVEIYRGLSADPKVVRRQRVEKKRRQLQGRGKAP